MHDLTARLASATGLDVDTARRALGIILDFIAKEAPPAPVDQLLDSIEGGRDMVNERGGGGSPGILGGFGSMGAMAALTELTNAGLSFAQVQTAVREVIAHARSVLGEDAVGEIVASIPGLEQFV